MKASEIRELSTSEIQTNLEDTKEELMKAAFPEAYPE